MARSYNDLGVEFKYLIVNDTDRKFGLYINTVGVQAIRPNSPYPIKDHPSGYQAGYGFLGCDHTDRKME